MDKSSYVYILASAPYGTLYIGVTNDIVKRVWQHREEMCDGFSKSYGTHRLVWFETHTSYVEAAAREKSMKKWKRAWKVDFISIHNPEWRDLYNDFTG